VWRSEYHHRKAKLFQQLAKTAPDLVAATQFRMLAAEQWRIESFLVPLDARTTARTKNAPCTYYKISQPLSPP
jgi:hypothetical protein